MTLERFARNAVVQGPIVVGGPGLNQSRVALGGPANEAGTKFLAAGVTGGFGKFQQARPGPGAWLFGDTTLRKQRDHLLMVAVDDAQVDASGEFIVRQVAGRHR